MILGNTICVENLADLKNYNRSITKTAMTYSNHTARQINPKLYEVPYIGQSATSMQVELDEELYESQEKGLAKIQALIDKNNQLLRILSQSKLGTIVSQNQIRYFDIIKQTRKEYVELEEKVSSLAANPKFTELEAQLEEARNKKKQLRLDYDRLSDKMADARSEKTRILEQIDDAKEALEQYLAESKSWQMEQPMLLNAASVQFTALKQRFDNNYDLISKDLAQSNVTITTQNAKLKMKL